MLCLIFDPLHSAQALHSTRAALSTVGKKTVTLFRLSVILGNSENNKLFLVFKGLESRNGYYSHVSYTEFMLVDEYP